MADVFNAEEFVEQLVLGVFDGRLQVELRKLSHRQLEQVECLLTERLRYSDTMRDHCISGAKWTQLFSSRVNEEMLAQEIEETWKQLSVQQR